MDIIIRRTMAFICAVLTAVVLTPLVRAAEQVEAQPKGDYLSYTVRIKKPAGETLSFAFTRLKKLDYVIQPGDTLEYDVYIETDSTGLGAIDGEIEKLGRSMRDNGFVDQNGQGTHPGMDMRSCALGKWWHRSINIALDDTTASDSSHVTVSKALTELQFAIHPDSGDYSELTTTVFYDNIVITNSGEEKLVIFKDAADFNTSKIVTNSKKNITSAEITLRQFTAEEEASIAREKESENEVARLAEEEKLNQKLEGKKARELAALNDEHTQASGESATEDSQDESAQSNTVLSEAEIRPVKNDDYNLYIIIPIAALTAVFIGYAIYKLKRK